RFAKISCEFPLKGGLNVGKQLKLADAAGSRYALFIGGDEAKSGQARLKDLATGNEELIDTARLEERLVDIIS
ncbi:MAG: hypothetical protein LBC59_01485, partial [Chitinispirillales bacterium]|nr:hypothetical protein [Chitinispirillales bacterium]